MSIIPIFPSEQRNNNNSISYNGTTVSSSSTISELFHVGKIFDDDTITDSFWMSQKKYDNDGNYIGSDNTDSGDNSFLGEWIQIQLPTAQTVKSMSITSIKNNDTYKYKSPRNIRLYGSNDSNNWVMIFQNFY